jgi:DNA-binding transcriptional MerR regulator
VRISELSRASGVPLPTLKFYLREGLLPAGSRTAPNQADYDDRHLHRLRLIRALTDVGRLPLASVREVVRAVEDERTPLHELLGIAQYALDPTVPTRESSPDEAGARAEVDAFIDQLGWRVSADAPARHALATALLTLRRMGWDVGPEVFERHAEAADRLAAAEVASLDEGASRAESVQASVVGTVVFEAALVALRRLAQEHHSALRYARD